MDCMIVNDPAVVAELKLLYPKYEEALVSNDVETLTAMFWQSPEVMRFGVTENLYGFEELEAFRKSRPSVGLARTIKRLDIVTFGSDYGSITLEFDRVTTDGGTVRGRQSQVWVRFENGWRIVAAHVSLLR
jgi:hypothetical protein